MRKQLLTIAVVILSLSSYAQKGNNALGLGADVGIPTGDFNDLCTVGFGGYLKGLFGVGRSGHVTLTYGYTTYKVKEAIRNAAGVDKLNVGIMPMLIGYRHNAGGLYLEPQLGYGIYSARAKLGNVTGSDSDGAFAWAIGGGFAMEKGFDFGMSYQSLSKDGSSNSWVSLKIGYNISFKK
jgi:hypothetical protein